MRKRLEGIILHFNWSILPMRNFLVLAATTTALSLNAFGIDCASAVQIRQRTHDGKVEFIAENVSVRPIVAYVVTTDSLDANGNPVNVFSGVFTDGDSLRPGTSMEIGSASPARSLRPAVDYLRLSDGWTCGEASTQQAKATIARFQK